MKPNHKSSLLRCSRLSLILTFKPPPHPEPPQVLAADHSHFVSAEELEASWGIFTPVSRATPPYPRHAPAASPMLHPAPLLHLAALAHCLVELSQKGFKPCASGTARLAIEEIADDDSTRL